MDRPMVRAAARLPVKPAALVAARVVDEEIRTGAVDMEDAKVSILGLSWAWWICYITALTAIISCLNVVSFVIIQEIDSASALMHHAIAFSQVVDTAINYLFCAIQVGAIGPSTRRETQLRNMGRVLAARQTRDVMEQRLAEAQIEKLRVLAKAAHDVGLALAFQDLRKGIEEASMNEAQIGEAFTRCKWLASLYQEKNLVLMTEISSQKLLKHFITWESKIKEIQPRPRLFLSTRHT